MEQTTTHGSAQLDGRMGGGKAWRRSRAGTPTLDTKAPQGEREVGWPLETNCTSTGGEGVGSLQGPVCPKRRCVDRETRAICGEVLGRGVLGNWLERVRP